jgi:uncharacterized protein DUF6152
MRRFGLYSFAFLSFPLACAAHHSVSAGFDQTKTIEIEGRLTAVRWQNPHILFNVEVTGADDRKTSWEVETLSANGVVRSGITSDLLVVGDSVRVAGMPARRGENRVWANNVLLPSGQELVLGGAQRQPRWSQQVLQAIETSRETEGVAADAERGVFRVWSGTPGFRRRVVGIDDPTDPRSYPLTAAARTALETQQSPQEDPSVRCVPKAMPRAMMQPYPIEIVNQGDTILLRIEEYDAMRTIHMEPDAAARRESAAPSPLGFSLAGFDGRALVVTTTKVTPSLFDGVVPGVALSPDAELIERFSPSEDGARLDYRITIHDPATFTEPVSFERHWINVPGAKILPYNCTQ